MDVLPISTCAARAGHESPGLRRWLYTGLVGNTASRDPQRLGARIFQSRPRHARAGETDGRIWRANSRVRIKSRCGRCVTTPGRGLMMSRCRRGGPRGPRARRFSLRAERPKAERLNGTWRSSRTLMRPNGPHPRTLSLNPHRIIRETFERAVESADARVERRA